MRRLLLASVVLLAASLAASIAMGDGAAGRMFLKQLAFIGDSGLGLVNSDGTDVRWLVRSGNARGGLSWSPDGRRVAFFNERAREKGATSDLYVVNVVSRSRTLVLRNAQDTSGDDPMAAAWSPDGSRLALTSAPTHKIWLIAPNGRQKRLLQDEAWKPAWSPDGTTIAYEYFYGELWQLSPDGTTDRLAVGGSPAWSPDGTQITYIRARDVWVMDADGSNQTRLTHTPMEESEPVWSPDGRTIAYLRDRTSGGGYLLSMNVFTIRSHGPGAKQLTRGNHFDSDISWSPDGRLIAVTRGRGGGTGWGTIVVVDVKRHSERRLVAGFDPAWRPTP